jgi:beta-galactosidase
MKRDFHFSSTVALPGGFRKERKQRWGRSFPTSSVLVNALWGRGVPTPVFESAPVARAGAALAAGLLVYFAVAGRAQTLTDLGPSAPKPGTNDISQLSTAGNQTAPDGLNYYTDNQTGHGAGEPGQTFITGTNPAGYVLTSVTLKTAGLGSYDNTATPQSYYLHIYSVSGGSVALLQTCTSGNVVFNDGDWLQWSGLSLALDADTAYAWSFGKASSTYGWEALAVADNNPYAGGQIGLFPPAGGTVAFGGSHDFDAVFDLGLTPAELPSINQFSVSPRNAVFSSTPVTFAAGVSGAPPLYFQWWFNNGAGYALIPGADTNTLTFNAAVTNTGAYELVLTNSHASVTSAPITLSVTLDTNPPIVLRGFNLGLTQVEVDFSEPVDAATAADLANYSFTDGLAVVAASLTANEESVLLTTAPLAYGSDYTLVINGLLDQATPPNMIATNTQVSFIASPRGRILLDNNWRFQLGDPPDATTNVTWYPEIPDLAKLDADEVGSATNTSSETYLETIRIDPIATQAGENVSYVQTNYNDSAWRLLNLPHDWVVELPFSSGADGGHGFKSGISGSTSANTIAWYRHTFSLPASYAGQALWLEFGGVYRNCLVWLNGHILGRNVSGYSSFYFDVAPYVNPGGTNVLVVRVDASRFEGWFYEGAGIYRHVWLTTENPVHVAEWGTYVATTSLAGSNAIITVQTDVTNESGTATANGSLTSTIFDANSNAVAAIASALSIPAGRNLVITQTLALSAHLWSPQTPYLYNLASTISNQSAVADIYNTPFGVRTVSIDSTNGVFINGQRVEIQGMCNHQDMAGVGSALPDRLQYYRLERLKEMGVSGCRTSHNEPTEQFLDACDQLGMLVLDENRRLGTNAEPLSELSHQIRRDRNHPSVFMWSLCNEEPLQTTSTGASIIQVMQNLVHSLDSTRLCTAALNDWGVGFSLALDVNGFNYSLGSQDSFHASDPDEPIIGTETSSLVSDRGIYTNDAVNGFVWGYDIESSNVGWGEPAEVWWPYYDARPWASGGFSWTGFDYRGEPTPYGWPCINSHFGTLDTCGFPKDNFYYYQANWTLKPVLHLFPHWNWSTPGQPVNVWVFGNCQAVELFVNGSSQGRQTLNVQGHAEWDNVAYAPGTLQAIGYNNGLATMTNTVVTTGAPAALAFVPDRNAILDDGRDVSVVTVEVLDAEGRVVPTATNLVNFTVTGGSILGVGNGNPSSHDADKASQRTMFNGLAEVIVQSATQGGSIALTATSSGLSRASASISETATLPAPAAPTGVAAVGGNAQVAVSWNIVPGAATYNVWRATTSGGPYTLLAGSLGGANLGYVDDKVTNLITYYYVITANGTYANGTSTSSDEANATPAAIVTGLTATAVNGQILLSWNPAPGIGYSVKRSTVSGGPYVTIASAIAGTNDTDSQVTTCQNYFYVVTVTNVGNESLPSVEASAEVPGALPPEFTSADVGAVGLPGNASYCDGQFSIAGSGSDIWGTADAFQFVYTHVPASTNCDFRAQVLSVQNTSANAKAALMIRESLAADSSHAMVDIEPSAGIEFIWRNGTGASADSSVVTGTAPNWIRLTRTNNMFTAYWSPDGNTWTQIGSPTEISMAVGAYIGLAVCAHNNGALCTSLLQNVGASFLPASGAPTLNPITNQTVNVGRMVTVNASATDTNSPPLTLVFDLLNAPAAATLNQINPTNAIFSWRPSVPDANTSNAITIAVVNNGLPSLGATQSFSILVNPLTPPTVSSIAESNGQLTLQLDGQSGPDYAVQISTNLFDWETLLITNSPAMPWTWTDTNKATLPAQFYRIKTGPPLP